MINDLTLPNVELLASAEVDGKIWYTVQLSMPTREWLVEQNPDQWHENAGDKTWKRNWFDVHESLYTMLMLKWK
jgi:hypothetical protein